MFSDGRRIVVDRKKYELRSIDMITLPDRTHLQKVESSEVDDRDSGFYRNSERISDVIQRFDLKEDDGNWLSMRPKNCKTIFPIEELRVCGEHVDDNTQGRGLSIDLENNIVIQYFEDNHWAPGNFTIIDHDGSFEVGECYMQEDRLKWKGCWYKVDGTSQLF